MKNQKTSLVQTRIATAIYRLIEKASREEGISIADYVRRLILRDAKLKGSDA